MPRGWTFDEACTMPTTWSTVWACFEEAAGLKRDERVLIHAATGGVGIVAVNFALAVHAIIYATAKPGEKHAYLRGMGVQHMTTTRDCDVFAKEMREMLSGSKLDVVLNSMSHENYIPESLSMLRDGGHFVEIGKRGIWTHEQMTQARPGVHYAIIAIDYRASEVSVLVRFVLRAVGRDTAVVRTYVVPDTCVNGGGRNLLGSREFCKAWSDAQSKVP